MKRHGLNVADVFAAVVTLAAVVVSVAGCGGAAARARSSREVMWDVHLRTVDAAIARRDVSAALRAWHDAYVTALADDRWDGVYHAADAYLRIGEISGVRRDSEPKARELYLTAFFRARSQRALDGVLRTAEAFATLGDRDVSVQCLLTAERMLVALSNDEDAARRVDASRAWIAEKLRRAESSSGRAARGGR